MKILIIEDDKWFAESVAVTIKNRLKQSEIKTVFDIETAMDVIDEWQPDLLLLDVMLGATNGLMLLNELQSYVDTRQIPVIIMSVDGKRLNIDDLRQFKVVDIIDKTEITPEILINVIKENHDRQTTH